MVDGSGIPGVCWKLVQLVLRHLWGSDHGPILQRMADIGSWHQRGSTVVAVISECQHVEDPPIDNS